MATSGYIFTITRSFCGNNFYRFRGVPLVPGFYLTTKYPPPVKIHKIILQGHHWEMKLYHIMLTSTGYPELIFVNSLKQGQFLLDLHILQLNSVVEWWAVHTGGSCLSALEDSPTWKGSGIESFLFDSIGLFIVLPILQFWMTGALNGFNNL